jgi:hypothetical protein
MADNDPGAGYPLECVQLMERTMKCVEQGDIQGSLKMQAKANECLRRHGLGDQAVEMPEEYFVLMHRGILANRAGDKAELDRINARMDEIYDEVVGDEIFGEEVAIPIPEECLEALRGYMEAANRGDWDAARRHAAAVQEVMAAKGLEPLPLTFPEDYVDGPDKQA